jgi:hypothetical protein
MKNSTIIVGVSALVLVGAGAYIYFKGKKSPSKDSLGLESTTAPAPSAPSAPSRTPTRPTASTPPPEIQAPATVDTVVKAFSETQTPNYKKARDLSREIEGLLIKVDLYKTKKTKNKIRNEIAVKSKLVNGLGYKVLRYGEIEKM